MSETGQGTPVLEDQKGKEGYACFSGDTQTPHWTVMVRQRIIVRPLPGRMGRQQTAVRSWALNVINELPDEAYCHWATLNLGSPSSPA